jgi:23S rRNA U2552 (ribose-2'-O)-methylase RlmE/FtsJ
MAPSTTGIKSHDSNLSLELCERALDLSTQLLTSPITAQSTPSSFVSPSSKLNQKSSRNCLVMKYFTGEGLPSLLKMTSSLFERVEVFKPRACRYDSVETFIIAKNFLGVDQQSTNKVKKPDSISSSTTFKTAYGGQFSDQKKYLAQLQRMRELMEKK